MRICAILIFVLGFFVSSASAGSIKLEISGSHEPAFITAKDSWLDGKTKKALRELLRLADTGNVAAQILLARIEGRSYMHPHLLNKLSRRERTKVLQTPGRLFGQAWLDKAVEAGEPLAIALKSATKAGKRRKAILALFKMGEPLAALENTHAFLHRGNYEEFVAILEQLPKPIPEEAGLVMAITARNIPHLSGRLSRVSGISERQLRSIEYLNREIFRWFGLGLGELLAKPNTADWFAKEVANIQAWKPVYRFCGSRCADKIRGCVIAAINMGLYGRFPLRSPLQSLISDEEYWNSGRLIGDFSRSFRDLSRKQEQSSSKGKICFVRNMIKLQAAHGYAK